MIDRFCAWADRLDRSPVFVLAEFAELGHKLFRTTQEKYPIAFVAGDIFDSKHLDVVPPLASAHESTGPSKDPIPDLRSLTSLNALRGRVFAIHASSFFHLFDQAKQLYIAHALAGLLSPEPGSVIFGMHLGKSEKGFLESTERRDYQIFCHSPESWTQLWDGLVFGKGMVNVQAKLVQVERKEPDMPQTTTVPLLVWSVTRL